MDRYLTNTSGPTINIYAWYRSTGISELSRSPHVPSSLMVVESVSSRDGGMELCACQVASCLRLFSPITTNNVPLSYPQLQSQSQMAPGVFSGTHLCQTCRGCPALSWCSFLACILVPYQRAIPICLVADISACTKPWLPSISHLVSMCFTACCLLCYIIFH